MKEDIDELLRLLCFPEIQEPFTVIVGDELAEQWGLEPGVPFRVPPALAND
jgi:hypothetical protein